MSRGHSGNFRAKHPPDLKADERITRQVTSKMIDGRISCKTAHDIAAALNVPPEKVGVAIDLLNGRIQACQMGLFGYGKTKTIAKEGPPVAPELGNAIQDGLVQGRLACADAWRIAEAAGIKRLDMGRVCETMGVKINRCQLGAF